MKGVYIAVINISENIDIKIGKIGKIKFNKGRYAYIGSAQNNLKKRVKRHLLKNKKKFWHIDYLLANNFTRILKVYYKNAGKSEECKIAERLSKTEIPILNFGCSDCECKSHLFRIKNPKNILELGLKQL